MKDQDLAAGALETLARDAEDAIVLTKRRDVAELHALELETEDVERVGPFDGLLDTIENGDPELVEVIGEQRPRSTHADLGARRAQPENVGARDARVQHTAGDADVARG